MRRKIIAGNWKMNLSLSEGKRLASDIKKIISVSRNRNLPGVILCPPFPYLQSIAEITAGSPIETGAQNCSHLDSGALTGEVSASMIRSCGADWVIIGHSERRSYFAENDELLLAKCKASIKAGLSVIFCCGESLEQRETGIHFNTVKSQLTNGLFLLEKREFMRVVVAYEPVWAIGTGLTATPQQAQEMHAFIRKLIAEHYGYETAENTTILYGGSCKAANAQELFVNIDVDGGLIGGASLDASEFDSIISAMPL